MSYLTSAFCRGVTASYESLRADQQMTAHARHFHPPALTEDRLEHVVIPLVENLGRQINLFHFGSHLWDGKLRRYFLLSSTNGRAETADHISREQSRYNSAHRIKDSRFHRSIHQAALSQYAERLKATLLHIADRLDSSIPIIWRTYVFSICLSVRFYADLKAFLLQSSL